MTSFISCRFFRGLRMLVKACYYFLPYLGWSMVLLLVFMWMGTLVIGNLLQDFITAAWRYRVLSLEMS